MQNTENIYEINLTKGTDSQELIEDVTGILGSIQKQNVSVKLKLDDISINKSQMVFIKSLIESYGHKLTFVETTNDYTRNICVEMGINSTGRNFDNVSVKLNRGALEVQNSKLDDLRKEFKYGFNNSAAKTDGDEDTPGLNGIIPSKKLVEYKVLKTGLNSEAAQLTEVSNKIMEIKPLINNEKPPVQTPDNAQTKRQSGPDEHTRVTIEKGGDALQKQTISVYRKADEEENRLEFGGENVDFYAAPTNEPVVIDTKDTIYVNQTLRSGQILEYDGNVVIIGDCHPGSEIKAAGDITVWGVLGSIAHAGIKGNQDARIRALKMNAVQLRIANCYSRRPDSGNIPYIVKSSVFTPEEARIVDDNIVLFKLAQD